MPIPPANDGETVGEVVCSKTVAASPLAAMPGPKSVGAISPLLSAVAWPKSVPTGPSKVKALALLTVRTPLGMAVALVTSSVPAMTNMEPLKAPLVPLRFKTPAPTFARLPAPERFPENVTAKPAVSIVELLCVAALIGTVVASGPLA